VCAAEPTPRHGIRQDTKVAGVVASQWRRFVCTAVADGRPTVETNETLVTVLFNLLSKRDNGINKL
jgi:hypothetical protein